MQVAGGRLQPGGQRKGSVTNCGRFQFHRIVFHIALPLRIQSGAFHLLQGFEDKVLGSSPADTVATYCPGRPSQLK